MFHVTRTTNIDSILVEGIVPQIGERSLEFGEPREAVFAFPTALDCNTALGQWLGEWFEEAEEEAEEEEGRDIALAIIEFDPTGLTRLPFEVEFEVAFSDRVPPSAIRAIHSEAAFGRIAYSIMLAQIA